MLPLLDGQEEPDFIVIKTRLTNREQRQIDAAGIRVVAKRGDKEGEVLTDVAALDFEKVLVRLLAWSFTNDLGEPVQLNRDNLAMLDEPSFKEVVNAIDAWQEEQEEAKNGKPPGPGVEQNASVTATSA